MPITRNWPKVHRVKTFSLEQLLPDGRYAESKLRVPARAYTLVKVTTSDGVADSGESFGPRRFLPPWPTAYARALVGTEVDREEHFLSVRRVTPGPCRIDSSSSRATNNCSGSQPGPSDEVDAVFSSLGHNKPIARVKERFLSLTAATHAAAR